MKNFKILIIGLGTIGKNLTLSLVGKGYHVNVWDLKKKKTSVFVNNLKITCVKNIYKFIQTNNTIIILAIPAGLGVDNFINDKKKSFKKNSYIVDIGNSHPSDTLRRSEYLKKYKINYIGCGFSGGSYGARTNASIMVSCSNKQFIFLKDLLTDIVGKKNTKYLKRISDNPSAGHLSKIIHNGIEYGIMQSIADMYLIFKKILKLNDKFIVEEFNKLNNLIGSSYLIDITNQIIKNEKLNKFSIDNVLDKIDDNNTGAWAVNLSLKYKFPVPSISSSVEARFLSKQERFVKNFDFTKKIKKNVIYKIKNEMKFISELCIISCYLQGLGLLQEIANKEKININLKNVLLSWTKNSIIRSDILSEYFFLVKKNKININSIIKKKISLKTKKKIINIMNFLINNNITLPSVSSLYNWTNLITNKKNISFSLIQSQRNFFGKHKIKLFKT